MFCWLGRWLFHFHQVRYQFKRYAEKSNLHLRSDRPVPSARDLIFAALWDSGQIQQITEDFEKAPIFRFPKWLQIWFRFGSHEIARFLGVGGVLFHHVPISSPAATFLYFNGRTLAKERSPRALDLIAVDWSCESPPKDSGTFPENQSTKRWTKVRLIVGIGRIFSHKKPSPKDVGIPSKN